MLETELNRKRKSRIENENENENKKFLATVVEMGEITKMDV